MVPKILFKPLEDELRKSKSIAYVRNKFGNIGDRLIEQGVFKFFSDHNISYTITEDHNNDIDYDLLVFYGGGNLGFPASNEYRNRWLKNKTRKIILPNSYIDPKHYRYNKDINLDTFDKVFIREKSSLEYCNGILVPDMALYLDKIPATDPLESTGTFLRRDSESAFSGHQYQDPAGFTIGDSYFGLAKVYNKIITDRLHFAIAGLLASRNVTLLPNNYHKNRSMYETWLADLGCNWSDTL